MAQEVSPLEVVGLQELRIKNVDTDNIAYSSEGTLDLLPPNRQRMVQDEQEESTPSQNWAPENHGTSTMSVELHTSFPERRDEQGNNIPKQKLTEEEEEVIAKIQDPYPLNSGGKNVTQKACMVLTLHLQG